MEHEQFDSVIGIPMPFQHLIPYPNKSLLATSQPQKLPACPNLT